MNSAALADTQIRYSTVEGGGGLPIQVAEAGRQGAPALVFLHGSAQAHGSWRYQMESDLADDYHLIAYDLRGHGDSGKPLTPEDYHACRWADDLAAVIAATGAQQPALVGWSMGGFIIGHYVRCRGIAGLSAIVMVATDGGAMVTGGPPSADLRDLGPALASPNLSDNLRGARLFARALYVTPPDDAWEDETVAMIMRATPNVRDASRPGMRVFRGRPLTLEEAGAVRDQLTLPVLAILGGEDALSDGDVTGASYREALPHATVHVYDGIGHSPFAEAPERFNADLDTFMQRVLWPPQP